MPDDLLVPPSSGSHGVRTAYIDVSDLLMYLHHHSVVSGIQRVIVEVLPGMQRRMQCEYVAFSAKRRTLVRLDGEAVDALLEMARHSTESNRAAIRSRVVEVQASVDTASEVVGEAGDVLAVLGAAWAHEGFFSAVMRLRRQEVAVAVLVYDLIPVLVPGFPESVIMPFRQYLPRVAFLADRAPAISGATRRDLERYCESRGWQAPPGRATALSADQWQTGADHGAGRSVFGEPAWPRPFALFVATIETRKNHLLAYRAWRRLIEERGADKVPDLVCVGRVGWNCFEFLEEFESTGGLGGKMSLLTDQVSDQYLAALYRDSLFTVYPSRYEGWGLPVTESLSAGKPAVVAENSSLTEAGESFATYFPDNDLDGFVEAVGTLLDPGARDEVADRIRRDYRPPAWDDIAGVLAQECSDAVRERRHYDPALVVGQEYGLARMPWYEGDHHGENFLQYLETRRLPLTRQLQEPLRAMVADLTLLGVAEPPDLIGRPILKGSALSLAFTRPVSGPLQLVLALGDGRSDGAGLLRASGPLGPMEHRVAPGHALRVPLGAGAAGDKVQVRLESLGGGTVHLASFCLTEFELEANILVERRIGWAQAARLSSDPGAEAQLAYMRASLSWRVTRPLREGRTYASKIKRRLAQR